MTAIFNQNYKAYGFDIQINQTEIDAQLKTTDAISFHAALDLAISCFFTDNKNSQSPMWLMDELAEEYGLSYQADEKAKQRQIKQLMSQQGGCMMLLTSDEKKGEWSGKIDFFGEILSIDEYWIFKIINNPFIDIVYIAVARSGNQSPLCWGVN